MGVNKYHGFFRLSPIYVALEDVPDTEFIWTEKEVGNFDILWNLNVPLKRIAVQLQRTESSVFMLAYDRALKGEIKPRNGWAIW